MIGELFLLIPPDTMVNEAEVIQSFGRKWAGLSNLIRQCLHHFELVEEFDSRNNKKGRAICAALNHSVI